MMSKNKIWFCSKSKPFFSAKGRNFRSRVKKLRFSRAPPALEEVLEVGALPVVCRVEPFPEWNSTASPCVCHSQVGGMCISVSVRARAGVQFVFIFCRGGGMSRLSKVCPKQWDRSQPQRRRRDGLLEVEATHYIVSSRNRNIESLK